MLRRADDYVQGDIYKHDKLLLNNNKHITDVQINFLLSCKAYL